MARIDALRDVRSFDERRPVNRPGNYSLRLPTAGWDVWAETGALTHRNVDRPSIPGSGAEQTAGNPGRERIDFADWFRFHRRWNVRHALFEVPSVYHSERFIVPKLIHAIRPEAPTLDLSFTILRGYPGAIEFPDGPGSAGPPVE